MDGAVAASPIRAIPTDGAEYRILAGPETDSIPEGVIHGTMAMMTTVIEQGTTAVIGEDAAMEK